MDFKILICPDVFCSLQTKVIQVSLLWATAVKSVFWPSSLTHPSKNLQPFVYFFACVAYSEGCIGKEKRHLCNSHFLLTYEIAGNLLRSSQLPINRFVSGNPLFFEEREKHFEERKGGKRERKRTDYSNKLFGVSARRSGEESSLFIK